MIRDFLCGHICTLNVLCPLRGAQEYVCACEECPSELLLQRVPSGLHQYVDWLIVTSLKHSIDPECMKWRSFEWKWRTEVKNLLVRPYRCNQLCVLYVLCLRSALNQKQMSCRTRRWGRGGGMHSQSLKAALDLSLTFSRAAWSMTKLECIKPERHKTVFVRWMILYNYIRT